MSTEDRVNHTNEILISREGSKKSTTGFIGIIAEGRRII
jgi:hypothetical protein